jgi:hypothetical protein
LHAAGISLRLRHQDGGWQRAVKVNQQGADIFKPTELQTLVLLSALPAQHFCIISRNARKIRARAVVLGHR